MEVLLVLNEILNFLSKLRQTNVPAAFRWIYISKSWINSYQSNENGGLFSVKECRACEYLQITCLVSCPNEFWFTHINQCFSLLPIQEIDHVSVHMPSRILFPSRVTTLLKTWFWEKYWKGSGEISWRLKHWLTPHTYVYFVLLVGPTIDRTGTASLYFARFPYREFLCSPFKTIWTPVLSLSLAAYMRFWSKNDF